MKKIIYTIFLLFVCNLFQFAQLSEKDFFNIYNLLNLGQFKEAERLIQNYLSLCFNQRNKLDLLLKLSLIYWNTGNFEEYQTNTKAALNLAQEIKDAHFISMAKNFLEIFSLYNKGKSFSSQGLFQESISAFNEAIKLAQTINSPHHELKCRRLLSINYWHLKDYSNFLNENRYALNLAIKLNHKREQCRCLNNIGLALWKLDNYSEALNFLLSALQIARLNGYYQDESDILGNIAPIYRDLGNFDQALDYIKASLYIDEKLLNKRGIWSNKINMGSVLRQKYITTGDKKFLQESIDLYISLLKNEYDIDLDIKLRLLNNLASTFNEFGDFYSSLTYLNNALKIAQLLNDNEEESIIFKNLGTVNYNLGNYEQAIEFYKKSIVNALRLRNGSLLWEAYLELANAYKIKGYINLAIQNYKNSIDIIENIRSKLFLEEYKSGFLGSDKRLDSYHKLIKLLIEIKENNKGKNNLNEAFYYYEKAKARAFLDSIELSKIPLDNAVDQKLRYREVELMKEISNIYTKLLNPEMSEDQKKQLLDRLDSIEQELESLKREMRINNPAYANLQYPQFVTLEQAQKKLISKNTLVIAYLLSSDGSYAFAISHKKFKIVPLPPAAEIKERVRNYLNKISDPENIDFSAGYELFLRLIEPVLMPGIKRLIIIPDDILHFLPFETLQMKERENYKWLIEKYSISYAPSLTTLKEVRERKKKSRPRPEKILFALGSPTFEVNGNGGISGSKIVLKGLFEPNLNLVLDDLEFARQEVEKIAAYFPPKKRKILLSEEASEEKIKYSDLNQYSLLHFATHCIIDDKKPARSSIILRLDQDPQEDGLLQVREIFGLKLNADLVTLSACQTGFGKLIKGEGVEGLSRAFFYAGASALIMSLWSVNDQATSQLMDRFYYHLKSHRPIEIALQKTKLELIKSGILSHPYYWASFVAYGDTNKVIFKKNNYHLFLLSLIGFCLISIKIIKSNSGRIKNRLKN